MRAARTLFFPLLTLCLLLAFSPAAGALDLSLDSGLLQLVNKTHPVSADYVPVLTGSPRLRSEAADAYARMYAAMCADGAGNCWITSAYRSYATQTYLFQSRLRTRLNRGFSYQDAYDAVALYTAPPGSSEHQLGLAIDLTTNGALSSRFGSTPAGQWLGKHSWEYGFILRYDSAKTPLTMIGGEAWHYRYVGVPHAKLMADGGLCLEEYIGLLQQTGSASVEVGEATYHIFWTADPNREFPGYEILALSNDNAGGWIVTARRSSDPLAALAGHWSLGSFQALQAQGVTFSAPVDPNVPISEKDFSLLCGISGGSGELITRQGAALLLAPYLPPYLPPAPPPPEESSPPVYDPQIGLFPAEDAEDPDPTPTPTQSAPPLPYPDLAGLDPGAVESIRATAQAGLFLPGGPFRPYAPLTWGEAAVLAVRFRTAAF